ncbi:MAG: hypothetical protein Unbinned8454contig1000_21 [Prokaryotic dsDNA virus sp.]|nr:MAG: hypothetical protein Unbinned8454contig1000_21 [Prokaryotic dsDNA virus sp.]|tara:strand:+ start:9399 stop:9782 length:384 start_codon:yes stop_codon:yes gene_type:complete
MENKFNINDLELFIKSFKYCYFLEGDDKTHKRLDDSLELIQKLRKLVEKEQEIKTVYVVNHYEGGVPGESDCCGVYSSLEDARKNLQKVVKDLDIRNAGIEDDEADLVTWDGDHGWGQITIEENKLK